MRTLQLSTTLIALSLTLVPQMTTAKSNKNKSKSPKRPNILLINMDDMGYGDPSCYGSKLVETPNINRIAEQGVRCTNGYVTAPVSGVSRIGLLTGSYQQRYGMQWNHDSRVLPGQDKSTPAQILPETQSQIQTTFAAAGYNTAMAGKIGIPNLQPFETFCTSGGECGNHFPDKNGNYGSIVINPGFPKIKGEEQLWGGEEMGEYLADRLTRECIDFIDTNVKEGDAPFFFYLAYPEPHTPIQAKACFRDKVQHIKSPVAQVYAGMILSVDENIGKILDYLEKSGERDNTIVVFLSDNGTSNPLFYRFPEKWPEGIPYHVYGERAGLNGYKGTMWEGGIRVPYIVSWRGQLPEGVVYEENVSTLDIYPTLCTAARVAVPHQTKLDGVNLLPYFSSPDSGAVPHEYLYWFANQMGAVRSGATKMLIEDDYHYMFDLQKDMGERNNIMKEDPEKMKELVGKYFEFRNQMPAYRNPYVRPVDVREAAAVATKMMDASLTEYYE